MRLLKNETGRWTMGNLNAGELRLLQQLPVAADPGDCQRAQDRLFPPPLIDPSEDPELAADWQAYVTSALIERFQSDIETIRGDLRRVRPDQEAQEAQEAQGDSDEEFFRVQIFDEHAEAWYSGLNQARLVLSAKFNLHPEEAEGQGSFRHVELPEPAASLADLESRWLANIQSQFYAAIQEWLVQCVLSGWDGSEEDDDDEFLADAFELPEEE